MKKVIVIGNEANGVKQEIQDMADSNSIYETLEKEDEPIGAIKYTYINGRIVADEDFDVTEWELFVSTFDSKKEAEYYCELKMRLQAKEINGFCLQPTFILAPKLKYKADFIVFNSDNTYEVIDVKGFKTKEYIAKKKIFEDVRSLRCDFVRSGVVFGSGEATPLY